MAVIKALTKIDKSIKITLIYYDNEIKDQSTYKIPNLENVNLIPRSKLTKYGLFDILENVKPDILYISGWVDKEYLWATKKYKNQRTGMQVVTGIDDQWFGTLRQHLGVYYYKMFYKKIFDFFWVAGKPQYHYTQRFGLKRERIISNMLSADTDIFTGRCTVTKRFVFLGRFVDVKGIDILIDAYNSLPIEVKSNWLLVLIGDGPLKESILNKKYPFIEILPFLQPNELKDELAKGGVLCMPSKFEPWGVALHKLTFYGYPLILSSACGAATEFLISGYNGFLFKNRDVNSLKNQLQKMTQVPDKQLEYFSQRSVQLGNRITPEISAQSLFSVLELSGL